MEPRKLTVWIYFESISTNPDDIDLKEHLDQKQNSVGLIDFSQIIIKIFDNKHEKVEIYWSMDDTLCLAKMDDRTSINLDDIAKKKTILLIKTIAKEGKKNKKKHNQKQENLEKEKELEDIIAKNKQTLQEVDKCLALLSSSPNLNEFHTEVTHKNQNVLTNFESEQIDFSHSANSSYTIDNSFGKEHGTRTDSRLSLDRHDNHPEDLHLEKFKSNQETIKLFNGRSNPTSKKNIDNFLHRKSGVSNESIPEGNEDFDSDVYQGERDLIDFKKSDRQIKNQYNSKHKRDESRKSKNYQNEIHDKQDSTDTKKPDFKKSKSTSNKKSPERLNIFVLFSEPLVYEQTCKNLNRAGLNETKSYKSRKTEYEINEISKNVFTIGGSIKKSLYLNPLTTNNFTSTLKYFPQIIHIICRGRYISPDDPKESKYFIFDFENEKGESLPLTMSQIERYLKETPLSQCTVLFLSVDSSEEMVDMFKRYGPKVIVYLKKDQKVNFKLNKEFVRVFYHNLLKQFNVEDSFKSSRVLTSISLNSDPASYHKYCSHFHKLECHFKDASEEDLNEFFSKLESCTCPEKNVNIHNVKCDVSDTFAELFLEGDSAGLTRIDDENYRICCCWPDLSHDEVDKFGIWYAKEKFKKCVILYPSKFIRPFFPTLNEYHFNEIERPFRDLYTVGFHIIIYKIFEFFKFSNGKIGVVSGDRGSGRTTIAKKFANYSLERHFFKVFFKRDLKQVVNFDNFDQILEDYENIKDWNRRKKMKHNLSLIILENADKLIKKDSKAFFEKLNDFVEMQPFRMLVTCNISTDFNEPNAYRRFEVQDLTRQEKLKIFYKKYKHKLEADKQNKKKFFEYMLKIIKNENGDLISTESVNPAVITKLAHSDNPKLLEKFSENLKECLIEFHQVTEEKKVSAAVEKKFTMEYAHFPFFYFICLFDRGLFLIDDLLNFYIYHKEVEQIDKIYSFLKRVLKKLTNSEMEFRLNNEDSSISSYREGILKINDEIIKLIVKMKNTFTYDHVQFSCCDSFSSEKLVLQMKHEFVLGFLKEHITRPIFQTIQNFFEFMNLRFCSIMKNLLDSYKVYEDSYYLIKEGINFETLKQISENQILSSQYMLIDPISYVRLHLSNFLEFFSDPDFLCRSFLVENQNEIYFEEKLQPLKEYFWNISVLSNLSMFDISVSKNKAKLRLIFNMLSFSQNLRKYFADSIFQFKILELHIILKSIKTQKYENKESVLTQKLELIEEMFESDLVKNAPNKNERQLNIMRIESQIIRAKAYRYLSNDLPNRKKSMRGFTGKYYNEYKMIMQCMIIWFEHFLISKPPIQLTIKVLYYQCRYLEERKEFESSENSFFGISDQDNETKDFGEEESKYFQMLIEEIKKCETFWNPFLMMKVYLFICKIAKMYSFDEVLAIFREKVMNLDKLFKFDKFRKAIEIYV